MSITIEDFNSNFLVHIRDISIPHIDDVGIIPASVGINIICKTNNRVQYFEYHFMDQVLVDASSEQQLIDLAWLSLKSDINIWATNIINEESLLNSKYIPSSNFDGNLTLTSFNNSFDVNISRFEVYPVTQPNSWLVGFTIKHKFNNENIYTDTRVYVQTFAVTLAEQEILDNAWDNVKDHVGSWASSKINISSLINTTFIPSFF